MTEVSTLARRLALGQEVASTSLSDAAWSELASFARDQRLEGVLLEAVTAGRLPATDEQHRRAEDWQLEAMERCVSVEALVGRICDELQARGIPLCALKGLAACRLDRPHPELRSYFDADLLVRPEHLDSTYSVLASMGLRRRFVEPAEGFDRRFGKGSAFVAPDHREIDLHRTLAMGSLGISVDADELWSGVVPITVAGRSMLALGAEARALHACVHAAASSRPPRWQTLLDLIALDRADLDLSRFTELCRSWRYDEVVTRALHILTEELGPGLTPHLDVAARQLRSTRWQRTTLRAYRRVGAGYAARTLVALPVIDGWWERARFVRALARPQRRYVDQVHGSSIRRWRSAVADVRAIVGRPR